MCMRAVKLSALEGAREKKGRENEAVFFKPLFRLLSNSERKKMTK